MPCAVIWKRFYLNENVYDLALRRINYIFDEFPKVVACVSGGKDSDVIFYLTMKIATERGRLPLDVLFIDEEGEWSYTIEHIRAIMYRPDVNPRWYQIPMKIENRSSKDSTHRLFKAVRKHKIP